MTRVLVQLPDVATLRADLAHKVYALVRGTQTVRPPLSRIEPLPFHIGFSAYLRTFQQTFRTSPRLGVINLPAEFECVFLELLATLANQRLQQLCRCCAVTILGGLRCQHR